MCFVFIWEQTATCASYVINWLVFITEMESVYCAVRNGSLNKAVRASSLKVNLFILIHFPSAIYHRRIFTMGQCSDLFLLWHNSLFSYIEFKATVLRLYSSAGLLPPLLFSLSFLCFTQRCANFKLFITNLSPTVGRNFVSWFPFRDASLRGKHLYLLCPSGLLISYLKQFYNGKF